MLSSPLKLNFNSIKVRLERPFLALAPLPLMNFNSIKVRLERMLLNLHIIISLHFNSIKVRLEHYGAAPQGNGSAFQFHKGAIRTHRQPRQQVLVSNFNSIKVRLEHTRTLPSCCTIRFQFHKGAIRTINTKVIFALNSVISIP